MSLKLRLFNLANYVCHSQFELENYASNKAFNGFILTKSCALFSPLSSA